MSMSNSSSFMERKAQLSPVQYQVTQEKQTERPFSNKYNKHWEAGSYLCVICDTELFRSDTKFESKSGWPAFSNVVDVKRIKLTPDLSHIGGNLLLLVSKPDLARTSVECANCNAHLGHLFHDGPKPTGLRYCINSSSLNFVSLEPSNNDGEASKTSDKADGKAKTVASSLNATTTTKVLNSSVKEGEATKMESKKNIVVQRGSCPNNNNTTTTGCGPTNSSSNSAKICFFSSPITTTSAAVPPNTPKSTAASTTTTPHRLIVNSSSSGNLGSRNTWNNSNGGNGNNNNSMVRRRISLFSSGHMPQETISIAPRMMILRETSL